jgi:hypothetical protein
LVHRIRPWNPSIIMCWGKTEFGWMYFFVLKYSLLYYNHRESPLIVLCTLAVLSVEFVPTCLVSVPWRFAIGDPDPPLRIRRHVVYSNTSSPKHNDSCWDREAPTVSIHPPSSGLVYRLLHIAIHVDICMGHIQCFVRLSRMGDDLQ